VKRKKRRKKRSTKKGLWVSSTVLFHFSELFFFAHLFTHGQNIVETFAKLGFSLFCPCFASLHLPQAALGFAPFHRKEKGAKIPLSPAIPLTS
jgi:hypothetical protein